MAKKQTQIANRARLYRGVTKDRDKVKVLIKAAEDAGWTITITRSNHLKFVSPDGQHMVIGSLTANTQRSVKYLTAHLRKAGLKV